MSVKKGLVGKHPTTRLRKSMRVALWLLVTSSLACAPKIPNIRPFATETAGLYQANGRETQAILTQYNEAIELAEEVLKQSKLRLTQEPREIVEGVRDRLETNKEKFGTSSQAFGAVLQQAVSYSEKLAELAAAGKGGAQAADSLAESINGFGALAGAGALVTGPAAEILRRVADYYTAIQARKSLREAAEAAQKPVAEVAKALKQIHSNQLQRLVSSVATEHDRLLLYEAGFSITGYYREASERRDQFYRKALSILRRNDDGISGFCRSPETGKVDTNCISLLEMQALREVEERLKALKPEFEEYRSKRNRLRSWRELRRANGARIVQAIDAWTTEHESVVAALHDGSGVSSFSLRAVLAEIKSLQ